MNSTGQERTFSTGAVRDAADKKPMLQLISPHALFRLGEWLRFACKDRKPKPYPPRNWEKGMPFSETVGSLERHIQKFKLGNTSEDHLAAILFGAMALVHYEEEIKADRMNSEIDDMPKYEQRSVITPHIVDEQRPEKISTFYIAGPMRGHENYNFPAFDAARKRGEKLGYNIISPADLDREAGIDPVNKPGSGEVAERHIKDIIQRDIDAIMSLQPERGDGIAVLPGWQDSTGARAEIRLAQWLGLRIIRADDFLTEVRVEVL